MEAPPQRALHTTSVPAVVSSVIVAMGWATLLIVGKVVVGGDPWPAERAVTSASLAILLAEVAVVLALPRAARLVAAGLLLAASVALALVDLLAFRHYQDVLSVGDWRSAANLPWLAASIKARASTDDLLLLLPIVAAAAALGWSREFLDELTGRRRLGTAAGIAVAGLLAGLPAARLIATDPNETFEFAFQRRQLVTALGLPAYHVYDVIDYATQSVKQAQARHATDLSTVSATLPAAPVRRPLRGAAAGANVIMVSVESLQSFAVGLHVNGQAVAPNLAALAADSLVFPHFIDQSHRGTTSDAEWMALQSLYPLAAGAVSTRRGGIALDALPSVLRREGYVTRSAAAEPPGVWNMGRFSRQLGFDESWFVDAFMPAPLTAGVVSDGTSLPGLAMRLDRQPEPFMAYVLTQSSHHPYDVPAAEQRLQLGDLSRTELGRYLQAVNYSDRALGRFLDELRSAGRLDRTLLVVFGDHTAALELTTQAMEVIRTAPAFPRRAQPRFERWWARQSLPLLIRLPGAVARGPISTPGGQLDLAPTVLGLLGIGSGPGPWFGRDLLAEGPDVQVFTRHGLVADEHAAALPHADGGGCFTWVGQEASCAALESLRHMARQRLLSSDALITGDLVKTFAASVGQRVETAVPRVEPVLVIAHRGDSIRWPENTAAALKSAFDVGADLVEIDIRFTRDRQPVIFHDETLDVVAGRRGRIEELPLDQVLQLDVGRWRGPQFAGIRPLTLAQGLRLAAGRGGVLLDVKNEGMADAVAAIVRREEFDPRQILVGGWTPTIRESFRRALPGARILRSEPPQPPSIGLWLKTRAEGAWGWELEASAPPEFIAAASRRGLAVLAYTVNDEAAMRGLIAHGIAGIETDAPALLRRIVNELGVGTRASATASGPLALRW